MKSYCVTIQMKPFQQFFHMVLFVLYVVLIFESGDEILWCDHSDQTSSAVLSLGPISSNFRVYRRNLIVRLLK